MAHVRLIRGKLQAGSLADATAVLEDQILPVLQAQSQCVRVDLLVNDDYGFVVVTEWDVPVEEECNVALQGPIETFVGGLTEAAEGVILEIEELELYAVESRWVRVAED